MTIPKKIHYCWFGGKDLPELAKACIRSWQEHLPDYEIVRWDESNCPNNKFVDHHLNDKNWAFVPDFVRLHALYNHGGIYLDTDIEVIKSFDDLLEQNAFLGYEAKDRINNAVVGSRKGNLFFKDCMDYIMQRHLENEPYEISPVVTTTVARNGSYDLTIYDEEYFYPYNPFDSNRKIQTLMLQMITSSTYAIHHWAKSWDHTLEGVSVKVGKTEKHKKCGICDRLNRVCKKLSKYLKQKQ
jgi:mannosyltransferase OCH1-like enzyme